MKYVYLLKIRQIYSFAWNENDLVFQSTANAWLYLQDLWKYWESIYSSEDLERIPSITSLSEIRNALKNSDNYAFVEVGFVNDDDPMSLHVSLHRMYIY